MPLAMLVNAYFRCTWIDIFRNGGLATFPIALQHTLQKAMPAGHLQVMLQRVAHAAPAGVHTVCAL